jgi:hypothetical protein
MNNKQPLNESAEFWIGLIGTKALSYFGWSMGTLLSAAGLRKIIKKFGGMKGFVSTLRDKKALRAAGFTDDQIRSLWAKNGKNLNDLTHMLAQATIDELRSGSLTPNEALLMYRGYIPKGEAAHTLERFKLLYNKNAGKAASTATTATTKTGINYAKYTQLNKQQVDAIFDTKNKLSSLNRIAALKQNPSISWTELMKR